jgi:hypothetical protein
VDVPLRRRVVLWTTRGSSDVARHVDRAAHDVDGLDAFVQPLVGERLGKVRQRSKGQDPQLPVAGRGRRLDQSASVGLRRGATGGRQIEPAAE